MRTIGLLAGLAILAGCKSTGDVAQYAPMLTLSSQRSVAEISACLAAKAGAEGAALKTTTNPKGVDLSYSIPVAGIPSVTSVIRIEDEGATRKISLHAVGKPPKDMSKLDAYYRSCA
jgi:hypothetical protein